MIDCSLDYSKDFFKCTRLPNPFNIITIGKKLNRIDYSLPLEDYRTAEKELLSSVTGVPDKNIIFLNQVHGDEIIIIDNYPNDFCDNHGNADALISNLQDICLVIRTADCLPVMLFDYDRNVIATVHSGRKGTFLDIAGKTVLKMISQYQCNVKNISAVILPSITVDSYQVSKDIADTFPCDCVVQKDTFFLDLQKCVIKSLNEIGIYNKNIFNANMCTFLNNEDFFSHRRGDVGRNLNCVYMKV
jgi:hypothetical protein